MKKISLCFVLFIAMASTCFADSDNTSVTITASGFCVTLTQTVILTANPHGFTVPVLYQWKYKDSNGVYQSIINATGPSYEVYEPGIYGVVITTGSSTCAVYSNGICISACTIVSVPTITSFSGKIGQHGAEFAYSTSEPCRMFLQASKNGQPFHDLWEVHGSNCIDNTFTDSTEYRLRAVLTTGEDKYSKNRVYLQREKKHNSPIIYSRPFDCAVYDSQARKVLAVQHVTAPNADIDTYITTILLNGFTKGIYFVKIFQSGKSESHEVSMYMQ